MSQIENNSIVIGIGNETRGDDAIGLLVAKHLSDSASSCLQVSTHSGEAFSLIETWQGFDKVYVVDAMCSGQPPGAITQFRASDEPLPASLFEVSTHGFGVPQAIELARALGKLPDSLVVIGVEGLCFDAGAKVSAQVEQAIPAVIDAILLEIRNSTEEKINA